MSEFNFLENANGYHIIKPQEDNPNYWKMTLDEKNNELDYKITVNNVPYKSILLKIDERKFDVSGFFSNGRDYDGMCKKADYILIDSENQIISFIELKKRRSFNKTEITQQLIGAECIFKYIVYLISKYFKSNTWIKKMPFDDYELNYVAFNIFDKDKGVPKMINHRKETTQKSKKTSAENFFKIDVTTSVSYRRLIPKSIQKAS